MGKQQRPQLPKRSSRHGVGKEIAGAIYVHRRYEHLLGDVVGRARTHIPDEFCYHVVKYVESTGNVSFIESNDFDTADEPTAGRIATVKRDGTVRWRERLADPQIYHHKWLFVGDDYEGFNVEASEQRSRRWMALDGIDRSRIGRRSYWLDHVVPRIDVDSS